MASKLHTHRRAHFTRTLPKSERTTSNGIVIESGDTVSDSSGSTEFKVAGFDVEFGYDECDDDVTNFAFAADNETINVVDIYRVNNMRAK